MSDEMRMFWVPMVPTDATPDQIEKTRHEPNVFDLPVDMVYGLSCHKILTRDYGYTESLRLKQSVDGNGDPTPMFTYPAIEYLEQLDLSDKDVFEFGAGNSTRYFSRLARSVTAVDNNREWVERLDSLAMRNVSLRFAEGAAFTQSIHAHGRDFDVIIVDGKANRYDCAREALRRLRDGGMIILDDADSYHQTSAMLRRADLIEIDLTGFKPICYHSSTTSFFLHRRFDFAPRGGRQPHFGVGGRHYHSASWDRPSDGSDP